jgi:hypothetical protein
MYTAVMAVQMEAAEALLPSTGECRAGPDIVPMIERLRPLMREFSKEYSRIGFRISGRRAR